MNEPVVIAGLIALISAAMGDEFGQQIEAIRAASDQQFQDAVEAKRLELMATYN